MRAPCAIGSLVEVAGTTAVDEQGAVVGRDDPYQQTYFILGKIEKTLHAAGAGLTDVIDTHEIVASHDSPLQRFTRKSNLVKIAASWQMSVAQLQYRQSTGQQREPS
jgi:enamine deaminase RidA (YjgF/YER057c/UK114 family)